MLNIKGWTVLMFGHLEVRWFGDLEWASTRSFAQLTNHTRTAPKWLRTGPKQAPNRSPVGPSLIQLLSCSTCCLNPVPTGSLFPGPVAPRHPGLVSVLHPGTVDALYPVEVAALYPGPVAALFPDAVAAL